MELAITIAVALLVGLGVGVLSGMLGIGGGTILVPLFRLGFHMAPLVCTATSLFTVIPTAISGSLTHIRKRTCLVPLGVAAGIGGACMSPVGVWLASISPEWGTMIAAAGVVLYSSITMFSKALKAPAASQAPQASSALQASEAASSASDVSSEAFEMPSLSGRKLVLGILIGLIAGIFSGYVGVGGGFIMVPLFMQLLGTPMKLTSGTSLIAVMILAVPGVVTQGIMGNVDWLTGILVACGSIPGAVIGSRLMTRVPERTLRFIFAIFLLIAAALLVLNQLNIL